MRKTVIPVLGVCMACLVGLRLPVATALAASPPVDEKQTLGLYFSENELVEVATRAPKPVSQVAENVTIITAEEIEAMNAHTVAEILDRVPGVAVRYPMDFGSESPIIVQGSAYEHVLVLVDGIRWNNISNDFPETNSIPVQIIKRIEIIKGPGSSTWGSSLGGVVNIITKEPAMSTRPAGTVSASYGEADSQDYRAELTGSYGRLGYYLYGGKQKSDGLVNERFFDSDHFYGKMKLALPAEAALGFTFGYSAPGWRSYRDPIILDEDRQLFTRIRFATTSFDMLLTRELALNLAAYLHVKNLEQPSYGMGGWWGVPAGDPLWNYKNDMEKKGASTRLAWSHGRQAAVLGAEVERRRFAEEDFYGTVFGGPVVDIPPNQYEEAWAVYANATIQMQRLTVTPGVRYDHHSISENITSPSLGATYQLGAETLLRAQIAKGFRKPPLFQLYDVDPASLTEEIWSYQAGLETAALRYFHLKTTLFHHVADKVWEKPAGTWVNRKAERTGGELEVETAAFHDFSLAANYTYWWTDYDNSPTIKDDYLYMANIFLRYNNPVIARAELAGHFIRWDENTSPPSWNGRFDDLIWTLNISREIAMSDHLRPMLFLTAHNLFGGSQYFDEITKNPGRWVEAGIRVHFN